MEPEHLINRRRFLGGVASGAIAGIVGRAAAQGSDPSTKATVLLEEDIYQFTEANNGAGPMWCRGSTCIVRSGEDLFVSGLETLPGAPPLNNCRWNVFRRAKEGWKLWATDRTDRTREPAPLATFEGGPLLLSANPTLGTGPEPSGTPAEPRILKFDTKSGAFETLRPRWSGAPRFVSHSYRSIAADPKLRELIIFQNVAYVSPSWGHAEWAFLDATGNWSVNGRLDWPWGADYETPQSIRICYPTVALRNRSVHFCGVSDILEPRRAWRAYKRELTGQDAHYVLRRLFYTWCPDVTQKKFEKWIELSSVDEFGGRILTGDLWLDAEGLVHITWEERVLDERLRPRFFPSAIQTYSIKYAVLKDGQVLTKKTLVEGREATGREVAGCARFHAFPDGRLFVIWFVEAVSPDGQRIAENRYLELRKAEIVAGPRTLPLRAPFTDFFTTSSRAGSSPSTVLELLGRRLGAPWTISYAMIQLR